MDDTISTYGPFNTVIGADVIYSTQSAESLARLVPRLMSQAKAGAGSGAGEGKKPLVLLAHEVRHTSGRGNGGQDDSLIAFLRALCLPGQGQGASSGGGQGVWELTAQELVKGSEEPYNVDNTSKVDASRISNMPRTQSGTAINAAEAMAAQSAPPSQPPQGTGMRITKPESKPNLHVTAHIRAQPLEAPEHQGEDGATTPTPDEIIRQAATQAHGSVLLLTLTPA